MTAGVSDKASQAGGSASNRHFYAVQNNLMLKVKNEGAKFKMAICVRGFIHFSFISSSQVWFRQPEWSLLQRAVPSNDWCGGTSSNPWVMMVRATDREQVTPSQLDNSSPAKRQATAWIFLMTGLEANCLLTGAEKLSCFLFGTGYRLGKVSVISLVPFLCSCCLTFSKMWIMHLF